MAVINALSKANKRNVVIIKQTFLPNMFKGPPSVSLIYFGDSPFGN